MIYKVIGLAFLMAICVDLKAQEAEPNYEVKPQKTNCDSLLETSSALPEADAIQAIEKMVFRYTQKMSTRATTGFQEARWYSCNNSDGFLILKIDNKKHLLKSITTAQWNSMLQGGDPYGYYLSKLKDNSKYRYP